MSIALPNLVGDRAIIQGGSYNYEKHTGIVFPGGDWRLWVPRGQIRTNLKELPNELLADWDWGEPEWDEVNNKTIFYPQLTWEISANLPSTKYQGTGLLSVKSAHVYDMEIALDGVVKKGAFAYIQVIGEVTYDA